MKAVFKNTTLYTIGQIVPQAAGLILLPIYTRFLSPSDYGIISAMGVITSFVGVFLTLSLERSIVRLYWDYKNEKDKKIFLGTVSIAVWVQAILITSLLFTFSRFVGMIYKTIDFYPFFAIAILSTFFGVFPIVPKKYLMLKQRAGLFVALSLVQFFLNAGIILWFVIGRGEGAVGYLKGNLYSGLIIAPIFLFITTKTMILKFDSTKYKPSVAFSLPIIPAMITTWVFNLSDRIFIERYFTLQEVGLYSLGYKIAGLLAIFADAYGRAYEPEFFRLANHENQDISKNSIYKYHSLFLMATLLGCLLMALFSKDIVAILFEQEYQRAHFFIPFISVAYFFIIGGGVIGRYFLQSKKMMANMYIAIFASVLNLGFNFLLIPQYGALGAAYATIISVAIPFGIGYVYTRRNCYFVPFNWKQLFVTAIAGSIIILSFEWLNFTTLWLSLLSKSAVLIFITFMFLKKFGLFFQKTSLSN